jgi:hypothetical protein
MEHNIIIDKLPDGFVPGEGMKPFNLFAQRKMSLGSKKKPMLTTVGIHYAGWFRASGEETAAADALRYGLLNAQLALGNPRKIDFDTLFTKRLSEVIAAANEALTLSESPCRIEEIVFAFLEYCIPDEAALPRYEGILIGKSASHRVLTYQPTGIEGEWQCVCGAFSPPQEICTSCGLKQPIIEWKRRES